VGETKRLHGEYSARFRPVDPADYQDLERYVLFAEVLDLAYAGTMMLPFLNAMLKCLDTLTAVWQRLDVAQRSRLQNLIAREGMHIGRLAEKLAGGGIAR
jgi:methionyl-tRNA formyltransferase